MPHVPFKRPRDSMIQHACDPLVVCQNRFRIKKWRGEVRFGSPDFIYAMNYIMMAGYEYALYLRGNEIHGRETAVDWMVFSHLKIHYPDPGSEHDSAKKNVIVRPIGWQETPLRWNCELASYTHRFADGTCPEVVDAKLQVPFFLMKPPGLGELQTDNFSIPRGARRINDGGGALRVHVRSFSFSPVAPPMRPKNEPLVDDYDNRVRCTALAPDHDRYLFVDGGSELRSRKPVKCVEALKLLIWPICRPNEDGQRKKIATKNAAIYRTIL